MRDAGKGRVPSERRGVDERADLGFGRIVASEIVVPILLVSQVESG